MKTHWAWTFVTTMLTCLAGSSSLFGQMPYQPYPGAPGGMPAYGPQAPNGGAYGGMPASYGAPDGEMAVGDEYAYGEDGGGYYGGEEGEYYDDRHLGRNLLDLLLPDPEGGVCAPRWFDASVEAVRLQRDEVARRFYDFAHDGQGAGGTSVLNSNNLDFDAEYGFKAALAFQVGAGGAIELGYMGTFNFNTAASVTSPTNSLFSVFSNFGNNPAVLFDQVDRTFYQDIQYSSAFNSFEVSYRRRAQGEDCRLQTSWLAGIRYFELNEDFVYNTRRINGPDFDYLNYRVHTGNAMTGFQIGGDAWITLMPGLRMGAELKAGIYGNHARQNTKLLAGSAGTTILDSLENATANEAALVSEANLMALYRINHKWTVKAGYSFMFIDGVALGIENFNPEPPTFSGAPGFVVRRTPFINTGGNVFYHGATLGLEYMW